MHAARARLGASPTISCSSTSFSARDCTSLMYCMLRRQDAMSSALVWFLHMASMSTSAPPSSMPPTGHIQAQRGVTTQRETNPHPNLSPIHPSHPHPRFTKPARPSSSDKWDRLCTRPSRTIQRLANCGVQTRLGLARQRGRPTAMGCGARLGIALGHRPHILDAAKLLVQQQQQKRAQCNVSASINQQCTGPGGSGPSGVLQCIAVHLARETKMLTW
jgi:hypothetical protein